MSADGDARTRGGDGPPFEQERLAALHGYAILDSDREQVYDDIVRLAAQICGTPIAAISFVDEERQWFKAEVGLGVRETSRDLSFCAHAILTPEQTMVVPDATADERFAGNALVTGDPGIRFYAGAPMVAADGTALGSLCAIDVKPRVLEPGQLEALQALSRQVVALLEARSTLRQLAAETRERERAQAEAAVAVERFRMVFESAPIAMAIADAAGVLADVNPSYAELLGYDREQLVGRPVRELIADDDVKLAELRGIGRTDVRQVAHRHADGHLLPTLVFTSVIRDASGAVVAYLGQVESVAERLAAQDLLLEAQSAVDAIITIDDRGRVLAWNVGAERMFGYARAEMLARSLTEVVPERFRALHQGGLDRLRDGGVPRLVGQTVEVVALRRDGGEFAAELSLSAWERAGVTNYTGVVRDVSERVAAEAQRLLAQTRAALLGSAAGAINQAVTLDRAIAAVLAQVCEATGWQAGHAWLVEQGRLRPTGIWQSHAGAPDERFRTLTERNVLASGEDLPGRVLATARSALDHAATTREPSPRRRAAKASGITTRLGVPILAGDEVVGVLEFHPGDAGQAPDQDWITVLEQVGAQLGRAVERQRAEQELTRRATHDPLTGLANRTLLLDHLQEASLRGRRDGTFAAVLFCDLDRFKVVNDSLGHAAGDELLQLVAARLASVLRPSDLLAHPGGDEFVVVCSDLADETVAQQVAARLLAALDAPFPLMGHDVVVDASIGVATTGREAGAEELLRYADLAMYRAKDQGGGRAEVFDDRFREQVQQRLSTESGLRRALEGDELRVHYQPIVELATGRVSSVEALVRWDRPGHGLVAPDRFIRLAEDTGLIVSLGAQVLRTACRQAARWSRERPELAAVGLAVNLSARQLRHPGLLGTVQAALDDSGLTPGRLTLELTESVLAQDGDQTAELLGCIKRLGVRIAIDDFGTGYSSLAYLRTFPIDVLKIDKRFVDRAGATRADDAIIETVIGLGRALGLQVVAEGVETAEQAALLRTLGCTSGQGYFFARPAPSDQLRVPDLAPGATAKGVAGA